ncbi:MAG: deoxyribose-phosphate aldolase [Oscillospiraceae bacterium]|nr:deoxyribose-phosphate aldolase [Oscillospiraceae bacterium]
MNYTTKEVALFIEHVQKGQTYEDLEKLCAEAAKYNFVAVAVGQAYVTFCRNILRDTLVHVSCGISFPLSQSTTEAKLFETKDALEAGAQEIGFGVNILEVKRKNRNFVEKEMHLIVDECQKYDAISKCTFENCYLSDEEKIWLCEIASDVKPDFIKTSTGFGTGGATVEDIRLMRMHASPDVGIKAAAGIRDLDSLLKMVAAGATRIGTTSGVTMIEQMLKGGR